MTLPIQRDALILISAADLDLAARPSDACACKHH